MKRPVPMERRFYLTHRHYRYAHTTFFLTSLVFEVITLLKCAEYTGMLHFAINIKVLPCDSLSSGTNMVALIRKIELHIRHFAFFIFIM